MRTNAIKSNGGESGSSSAPLFNPYQVVLKELYKLKPDECLDRIAEKLREILRCETVCILLWSEGEQKLVTKYDSGMPPELVRPEQYGPMEGITGKIIFSNSRLVKCKIDMEAHSVVDLLTGQRIDDETTKWYTMEAYASHSLHGDFKSLLGAPFFVRRQKLGAVKLINKLNGRGQLNERGFSDKDVQTLSYFLDAIEHVVEVKINEEQVRSLLQIGQKLIGTVSDEDEMLSVIAASCADALNYRVCLIRLLEDNQLHIRASNVKLSGRDVLAAKRTPSLSAVQNKIPLKCTYDDGNKSSQLQLESVEGHKRIKLNNPNNKFISFLHNHGLTSFLIVPIIQRGNVIGTIECYTALAREFSAQELNAIRLYVDALAISTINSRQQSLLTNLIELQRLGTITDEGGGEEEKVIVGVLSRMRYLLGRRLKMLAVVFSEDRLSRSKLNCKQFYGASKKELRSALGAQELDAMLGELSDPGNRSLGRTRTSATKTRRTDLDVIKIYISSEGESTPLGLLLLGLQAAERDDDFPEQVARLGAEYLGVMLGNVEEFRRSKGLLKIIDDMPLKETLTDIYSFILKQTTDFFGFDFSTISHVDYINKRLETVMSFSAKPDLVNPAEWMDMSSYSWGQGDILNDVFENKHDVIINAASPGEPRDPRLNEKIYTLFNHRDLARIWVPFIFRRAAGGSEQDDLVLGIIETGYHRRTQEHIHQQKRDLFVLFVDSCAKSLQRVALLEERKSIDDILKRFNQERNPKEVLRKLLEASVKLVRGDWGNITFLTHYDDKIRFLDDTIAYRLPPMMPGQLKRELEIGTTGTTGIVGYVAATGKPYWSNDVDKDTRYIKECPKVRSELAVPLRFSGQVIGVLDVNSNRKDWFDERQANLLQTVAEQGTILYQNVRFRDPLERLISPFNPFASPEEIYTKVIEIIEDFLITKTVSVWKKVAARDTFKLKLVAASEGLWEKYMKAGISTLPPDSFTGRAAAGEDKVQVNQAQIMSQFVTKQFAKENGLRSMTAVPIRVGDEIYGAIDVFSRRDTMLFDEEVMILQILASKAAISLQSATLVQSFNEIARISPRDDINSILERIALNALDILHAEPVILFRYDSRTERFDPEATVAGKLYYEDVQIATNENDMANMILKRTKPLYLENEKAYRAFEREVDRSWHSDKLPSDFWHREKIKSFAALKLEHRGEIVGVMFINYREPQVFSDSVERLIKVFTAQAASAIYNAKISEQNKAFWETQREDSLILTVSEVVYSLAHDAGHLLNQINDSFGKIKKQLDKNKDGNAQINQLKEEAEKMRKPLEDLKTDFDRLKAYRRLDEIRLEEYDINSLVKEALSMISDNFKKQRVAVDDKYAPNLPKVLCDENRIKHVLLNLFINALEAMEHKGKLSVTTSLNKPLREVEIRISDTGPGIPYDLRGEIFKPRFSTKKTGSGFGLPISRRIVEEHGGHIELGPSTTKGATFFVYLAIHD